MPFVYTNFGSRFGTFRIIELLLAFIIFVLLDTFFPYSEKSSNKWLVFLGIGLFVCFIWLCVTFVLNFLGQVSPFEHIFCVFAAIVYLGFGITGIYVILVHGSSNEKFIAACVLSFFNGVLFLMESNALHGITPMN